MLDYTDYIWTSRLRIKNYRVHISTGFFTIYNFAVSKETFMWFSNFSSYWLIFLISPTNTPTFTSAGVYKHLLFTATKILQKKKNYKNVWATSQIVIFWQIS